MTDQIGRYLGLPPMHGIQDAEVVKPKSEKAMALEKSLERHLPPAPPPPPLTREEEAENDHDYARQNMYSAIETGNKALEELLDVAKSSQHPRAYEVLATTIKTIVDANKELVNLSKTKVAEQTQPDSGPAGANVTNNNLFVGTPHDLLKVLAGMKNNGSIEQ